jgi:predicted nucleic acid-binding protein
VRTFFDSSAFAKRYIDEPGSLTVEELCMAATELALSIVCIPEIVSALNRRVREGILTPRRYQEVKQRLLEEVADAEIVNLTPPVLSTCTTILEASPVRALDALHVACAVQCKAELFVSADARQIAAAKKARLRVKSV